MATPIGHDADTTEIIELPSDGPEYFEISTTQAIPTKTGDEFMSDAGTMEGRPGSAGTMNSLLENDATADEAFLAANEVNSRKMAANSVALVPRPVPRVEFRKSASPGATDAVPAFLFPTLSRSNAVRTIPQGTDVTQNHESTPHVAPLPQPRVDHTYDDAKVTADVLSPLSAFVPPAKRPAVRQPVTNKFYTVRCSQFFNSRRRKRLKRQGVPSGLPEEVTVHANVQPSSFAATTEALDSAYDCNEVDATAHARHDDGATGSAQDGFGPDAMCPSSDEAKVVQQQHQQEFNTEAAHHRIEPTADPRSCRDDPSLGTHKRHISIDQRPVTPPPSNPGQHNESQLSSPVATENVLVVPIAEYERKMKKKDRQYADKHAVLQQEVNAANNAKAQIENELKAQHAAAVTSAKKISDEQRRQAHAASQQLESELADAVREKDELSKTVSDLQETVGQARELKKYVDSLSADFNNIDKRSRCLHGGLDECRLMHIEVTKYAIELRASHERETSLIKRMREAAEWLRKAGTELQAARKKVDTEREQRIEVQNQLSCLTNSNQDLLQAIQSSSDQVSSKLIAFHAILEESKADVPVSGLVEEALKLIKGIQSDTGPADRAASVMATVAKFSEKYATDSKVDSVADILHRFDEHLAARKSDAESERSAWLASLQSHMNLSLKELREDFRQNANLVEQDGKSREEIAALTERLSASQMQLNTANSRLTAAQKTETDLKRANSDLEARLSSLKSASTPAQEARVQLYEANTELSNIKQGLQTAETDLTNKSEEISAIGSANTQLLEQLQAVQGRMQGLQSQAATFERQKEELLQKTHTDSEHVRKEMREHVEQVELHLKAETRNEMKKLQSERRRLNDQVLSLQSDLDSANNRLDQLLHDRSQEITSKQELDRARKHIETQKQEIDALKESLAKFQSAFQQDDSSKEQITKVSEQLSASRSELAAATAHISELQDKCTKADAALKASEKNATEAEEDVQRIKAGLEHYKASCKQVIDDAINKGERQIEALQKSLSEAHAELEASKADDAKFRTQVENSWKLEQESHNERIAKLKHRLDETEQQRVEAQNRVDRSTSKCDELQARLAAASDQQAELQQRVDAAEGSMKDGQSLSQQFGSMQLRAEVAEAELSKIRSSVASHQSTSVVVQDNTPITTMNTAVPSKPRKALNRNTGVVSEVGRVPTPEALRPESRRAGSSRDMPETRQQLDGPASTSVDVGNMRSSLSPGIDPILKIRDDAFSHLSSVVEETQLNDNFTLPSQAFQFPSAVVEETQLDDSFKVTNQTFQRPSAVVDEAQFEDSCKVQAGPFSQLSEFVEETQFDDGFMAQPLGNTRQRTPFPSLPFSSQVLRDTHRVGNADFAIDGDSQDTQRSLGSTDPRRCSQLQDTLSWSQAEKDKYTFQKAVANPNSASKRVHPPGKASVQANRSASYGAISETSQSHRAATPHELSQRKQTGSNVSSSPHFVQDSQSHARRKNTYSSLSRIAGKRKSSSTISHPARDPRLVGRRPIPSTRKRKPDSQMILGSSGPATKKHSTGGQPTQGFRRPPRSSSSQLPPLSSGLRELPSYSSTNARSSTHMRTPGGAGARELRSSKKMSKSEPCF